MPVPGLTYHNYGK